VLNVKLKLPRSDVECARTITAIAALILFTRKGVECGTIGKQCDRAIILRMSLI
jgi:hypothetical protein